MQGDRERDITEFLALARTANAPGVAAALCTAASDGSIDEALRRAYAGNDGPAASVLLAARARRLTHRP